jgi:hypothetical protein
MYVSYYSKKDKLPSFHKPPGPCQDRVLEILKTYNCKNYNIIEPKPLHLRFISTSFAEE